MKITSTRCCCQKIVILTILVVCNRIYSVALSQPAWGQSSRNCQETISQVRMHLENRPNLTVEAESERALEYTDIPRGRPNGYSFQLRGKALDSVFNSPQMMKRLATDIINACDSIAAVTYWRWGSGERYSVGLLDDDGRIDFFTCAEAVGIYPGREQGNQPLGWGFEFCSI